MSSRPPYTARGAWWTTRTAALCPALAVLLAALVMCLGYMAHGISDPAAAPATAMSATVAQAHTSTEQHHVAAHPVDCPAGDVCCDPVAHGVRAVLATPAQPLPTVLPRTPDLPRPGTSSRCAEPPPTGRSPDLHVLQVQRT
ncbi:hypothetical protein ABT150_39805 [Streptomyces mirabilis]|uniref:hypothetical protein n=1 Tax=Streptomyces mirabilis TaxID=68239 RepID=UPI0033219FF9